jgi:hypothetical protein
LTDGSSSCGTEIDLPNEASLLRSVASDSDALEWFDDEQRWLPSAKALQFDPDGCSAFWREHLEEIHAQGPEDVATESRPFVYEMRVGFVRGAGFGARHSPDGHAPIGCAHSSVIWPGDVRPPKPERNRLRTNWVRGMVVVRGDVPSKPPPGA